MIEQSESTIGSGMVSAATPRMRDYFAEVYVAAGVLTDAGWDI